MSNDDDSFHSADSSLNDSYSSTAGTLGDLVRQSFVSQPRKFLNICHINAQSVPSHYSDLFDTFADADVHAVLISETWLKPHLLSTTYPLPGFILIRNDRVGKRGGGVAIYLKSGLSHKILVSSPANSATAEFIFIEACVNGAKIVLGVVYCPPCVDYFSSIEPVLESLGSEYQHIVIMGDFNTDLLSHSSSRSRKLLDITRSASLHVLPLQATHHNPDGHDTWLDLILTSSPPLVSSFGQYPAPGFSHHDLIYLSYILKPPKPSPKVLHLRSFRRMDVEKLRRDASNVNWEGLKQAATVSEKVAILNQHLINL
ncbi:uncharacterized protein LOC113508137 [Trichoplusia ni]|uniref:Uncharacterized protein LOC113508137 n=1 Tax=Trichoplusia ni TaxID=7111 RepID=A0A7E5X2K6_TRINI|nr:uncharacterized protein LOC113508137 [Trichoplusia ni]